MSDAHTLERRVLGRTGLEVSVMGLGSGGPSQLGQKRGTDHESVRKLILTALNRGVNLIDTAPGYGSSEELLGQAMRGLPLDELVICSKFNPFGPDDAVLPASELRVSLERSLRRLGTDHLDLFYLHAVPAGLLAPVMDVFADPLLQAVEDGLVRFTGVSEQYFKDHGHETAIQALDEYDFDALMVGYNLLSPSAASTVLPRAAERNVGTVIMSAVRGVIADPVRLEAVIRNWTRLGLLEESELPTHGPLDWLLSDAESIAAAAYAFAAEPAAVGCVLTGTASPAHLVENIGAISSRLSAESVTRLKQIFEKVGRNVGPADAVD